MTGEVLPSQRPSASQEEDEDEDEQATEETKMAEELGSFDEVVVWNHDVPWDATENSYAKGIGEWVSFASAVSINIMFWFLPSLLSASRSIRKMVRVPRRHQVRIKVDRPEVSNPHDNHEYH